jgi:hypothetical protein
MRSSAGRTDASQQPPDRWMPQFVVAQTDGYLARMSEIGKAVRLAQIEAGNAKAGVKTRRFNGFCDYASSGFPDVDWLPAAKRKSRLERETLFHIQKDRYKLMSEHLAVSTTGNGLEFKSRMYLRQLAQAF